MDLNDKSAEEEIHLSINLLIYPFSHKFHPYMYVCMFRPLKDDIWMDREIDGWIDR